MTHEPAIDSEGWQRQSTYDEPRLSEMAEMYREIGLEVHIEPFHPEDEKGCVSCLTTVLDIYNTIYTRARKGQASQGEE